MHIYRVYGNNKIYEWTEECFLTKEKAEEYREKLETEEHNKIYKIFKHISLCDEKSCDICKKAYLYINNSYKTYHVEEVRYNKRQAIEFEKVVE